MAKALPFYPDRREFITAFPRDPRGQDIGRIFNRLNDGDGGVIKRQNSPFPLDFKQARNLVHAASPVQNQRGYPEASGRW
ncbi:MAG: hypothetical protein WBA29_18640 [Xanthobacteraceae bacterium]